MIYVPTYSQPVGWESAALTTRRSSRGKSVSFHARGDQLQRGSGSGANFAASLGQRLLSPGCFSPVKSDAGFLHFLVGQEPDKRFIVQIDDLNSVAERVVKIAAKTFD